MPREETTSTFSLFLNPDDGGGSEEEGIPLVRFGCTATSVLALVSCAGAFLLAMLVCGECVRLEMKRNQINCMHENCARCWSSARIQFLQMGVCVFKFKYRRSRIKLLLMKRERVFKISFASGKIIYFSFNEQLSFTKTPERFSNEFCSCFQTCFTTWNWIKKSRQIVSLLLSVST